MTSCRRKIEDTEGTTLKALKGDRFEKINPLFP
jgi:hypothetical protein